MNDPRMCVDLGGIRLANPVVVASGTFGYGFEYADYIHPSVPGAVCVKGTTLRPRAGNPPPRLAETPCGMLNSIGLENPGIHAFVHEHLPRLRDAGATVIANIAGSTVDEFAEMAAILHGEQDIAGIELNVSCPNVERGGMHFGADPRTVHDVVKAAKSSTSIPVMPKLSPNVADIAAIALAAADAGANALSLTNTLLGMAIDVEARRPVLGNVFGGLSGPAIKPVALRAVYQVRQAVDLPILGGGGIASARDALEFIMAGANAVSVGTGLFTNPLLVQEVISGISDYLSQNGLAQVGDIVGAAVL